MTILSEKELSFRFVMDEICHEEMSLQIRGDGSQIRQGKPGARANSQRNEFVVSKISVFGETNPTHRRNTSLPGGTEDVTSLKRAAVGALGVPLKISAPSLKISSE